MTAKKRRAIYGGTFSPPHLGHVRAAEAFASATSPDELLIIPTFIPPHKQVKDECSPEHRINMCRIAFSHIKNARICDLEIKRAGTSYTYLTLEELTEPDTELLLLCGTDMFVTLDEWKNPERIFELANIYCVRRESDPEIYGLIQRKAAEYETKYGACVRILDADAFEVSSSEIRKRIKSADAVEQVLPCGVIDYIRKECLYQ